MKELHNGPSNGASGVGLFLEELPMPVSRVGSDGTILWANRAELDFLGYGHGDYIGHNIREFHSDPAACADLLARIARRETVADREVRLLASDGATKVALMTAHARWRGPTLVQAHLLASDITERRAREDKLVQSKQALEVLSEISRARIHELETLMNAAPVAIWVAHDRGCKRVTGNPESYRILRIADGTNVSESSPPPELHRTYRLQRNAADLRPDELPLQIAAAGGVAVRDKEFDIIFDDGVVRRMFGSALPLLDDVGQSRGSVAAFVDVTPLREAIRARDDFLSVASHELKTPLMTMELYTESLEHACTSGSSESRARLIEKILQQVEYLATLISQLLDVSRITFGRLACTLEAVDLGCLVLEVAGRFQHQAEKAGASIDTRTDRGVVGCWDKHRIDQVITNLVSNAVKYGAGKAVHLDVTRIGETARLTVRDQGAGIALEDRDRIFDRFERGGAPEHTGGLGVGLWIAKAIVSAHGGSIDVASTPGLGSTFTVSLPMTSSNHA
jgi:PAS domain S-box-containing protein